ncbi:MAG: triose-phosphate isomerase [Xanthomonadales bacterium PRO6]|nr:Triosephosphate isomerase [Xanthomonadales bacterium]MCE7930870.1 triose-phosphate isomerase [Xanthomonadales bacterium PRO6]
MRRAMVLGNWKMNGRRADAVAWARAGAALAVALPGIDVGVLPACVHLAAAREAAQGSPLLLGAQNLAAWSDGAYTGEVSGAMLADCGASHVLVGHSERRHVLGESDAVVAEKFERAQAAGLVPVLCLGETLDEREAGSTEAVVLRQLDAVLARCGIASLARAVIAYEPVWAIGTGRTASPAQAQEVHACLRSAIAKRDAMLASLVRILYGGSVKGSNAAQLFAQADIDGGLIGGASLVPDEFAAICRAA